MRDVVVIGAGPAGSVTAERLAARGHDVIVLEEHAGPGVPAHCTGLVGTEAFDEFGLPERLIRARASAARFLCAAGASVRIDGGRVGAVVIDRIGLDVELASRAVAAGAELRSGSRVDAVGVEADRVRVSVRGAAPIEARVCVLACGANYRFHRGLGLGLPSAFLQSAQAEVDFAAGPDVEVRFGRTVAPSGFAWVVPLSVDGVPRARIGLMTESRARDRFRSFLGSLPGATNEWAAQIEPRLRMLPLGPVGRTVGSRIVAVGDAAGLVKPTTGGGIYYGMLSGAMAAGVLSNALRQDALGAPALAAYERAWRRRLGAEIRSGLRFRQVTAKLDDAAIDALIDLARVDGVVPLLRRRASFNWHGRAAMALLGHPAFRRIVFRSRSGRVGAA